MHIMVKKYIFNQRYCYQAKEKLFKKETRNYSKQVT